MDTDQAKAERVYRSLSKRSPPGLPAGDPGFSHLSARAGAAHVPFPAAGLPTGADITRDLTDDRVHVLWKAVQHLGSEAHLLKGFLRFSDQQGVLVGEIEPKTGCFPPPPPLLHPVL